MGLFGDSSDEYFEGVYNAVKEWKPKQQYNSEAGYKEDLFQYLSSKATKNLPQKETGRHLADIGLSDKVGIEVKYGFHSKSEGDRLIGQLTSFLKDYKFGVIVVFCGSTDINTLNYVKEQKTNLLKPYSNGGILAETFERHLAFIIKE
ncbi:MAG: hypothetical protein QW719_02530 [Candidatus Micrarchaeaceae archaeon]